MIDILAIGAHPDDCEIFMGGTLFVLKKQKLKLAICDLSLGESGTYGSAEQRRQEAQKSGRLLGLKTRVALEMPDGAIENTPENQLQVVKVIRQLQPRIVFSFNPDGFRRHPDHIHCGEIVREAVFKAGIAKLLPDQAPWKPQSLLTFPEMIDFRRPDLVVDITEFWEKKLASIRCYSSQVSSSKSEDDQAKTFLHTSNFWELLESRSRLLGTLIGVRYGESFLSTRPIRMQNPLTLFPGVAL